MFTIIASLRAKHQLDHQDALAEGLSKFGVKAKRAHSLSQVDTKYVACWGWRKGKELRERGYDVLVMERGYIGNRFLYTSLGWNGLNGHASFFQHEYDGLKRFKEHGGILKPWKTGGESALILGQVPNDASLQGKNMMPWYEDMARQIRLAHDIPVYFRPHPDVRRKGIVQNVKGAVLSTGTLQEALEDAAFVCSYNSNSLCDAIINGVPAYAGDKGTMVYDLCSHDIGKIIMPDREKTLAQIAWTQWTMDEIKSGEALKGIVCKLS